MSGAPTPPVIPEPFANDANPLYINVIPDTTVVPGQASFSLGFPPLTMQPVAGGGKPPFGQDVNGILNVTSAHDFFAQAGLLFSYDAAVVAAISGYKAGAHLISTDGTVVWFNIQDGNVTDPDSVGNGNWVALYAYGNTTLSGLTGGTVTLTPSQYAKKTIVLGGILTSNLVVVVPGGGQRQWTIVNNTTGSFSTTVRSAAGTGVVVPQGGFANPVVVYATPADINIYSLTPISSLIPASQAADPLTLAERTNAGYLLATYLNQSSPNTENPAVGAVFVQNTGGDGFLRKATLAYFQSILALQSLGGQVQPSQIVSAAVTQFTNLILASAALTGTPTTPTAAPGTSSTQVASTAFANPGVVVNANGICITFPNGYKLQAGTCNPAGGTAAVTFPVAFTSSVFPLAISMASGAVQTWLPSAQPPTLAGMHVSNSGGSSFWIAVGL